MIDLDQAEVCKSGNFQGEWGSGDRIPVPNNGSDYPEYILPLQKDGREIPSRNGDHYIFTWPQKAVDPASVIIPAPHQRGRASTGAHPFKEYGEMPMPPKGIYIRSCAPKVEMHVRLLVIGDDPDRHFGRDSSVGWNHLFAHVHVSREIKDRRRPAGFTN